MRSFWIGRALRAAALATVASLSPWQIDAAYAGEPCPRAAAHTDVTADRRTTREIERRIASDETVASLAPQVSVSTSEGVVTLRGAVTSDEDRMVLSSLAESAPGVRHVDDRLEVRSWHAPRSALPTR